MLAQGGAERGQRGKEKKKSRPIGLLDSNNATRFARQGSLRRKNFIELANEQVKVTNEEIVAVLEDMVLKGEVVSNKNRVYQTTAFVQED
mgnify:CR=1 FL=1